MYDYREAVADCVKDFIESNYYMNDYVDIDYSAWSGIEKSFDDYRLKRDLLEDCVEDVTGRGQQSFTCDREEAKEYVEDNRELIDDMIDCGADEDEIKSLMFDNEWEIIDTMLREFVLDDAIDDVISDIEYDL